MIGWLFRGWWRRFMAGWLKVGAGGKPWERLMAVEKEVHMVRVFNMKFWEMLEYRGQLKPSVYIDERLTVSLT